MSHKRGRQDLDGIVFYARKLEEIKRSIENMLVDLDEDRELNAEYLGRVQDEFIRLVVALPQDPLGVKVRLDPDVYEQFRNAMEKHATYMCARDGQGESKHGFSVDIHTVSYRWDGLLIECVFDEDGGLSWSGEAEIPSVKTRSDALSLKQAVESAFNDRSHERNADASPVLRQCDEKWWPMILVIAVLGYESIYHKFGKI